MLAIARCPCNVPLPSLFLPQACQPSNAILYGNRASTYLKLKAYSKAVEDAQSAVSIDPAWLKVCACMCARARVCVWRACVRACVCVLLQEALDFDLHFMQHSFI